MKKFIVLLYLTISVLPVFAADIVVTNTEGIDMYYNYINSGTELEVTNNGDWNTGTYNSSVIIIPEEVVYMGRTRKVTKIGDGAFHNSYAVTTITIPQTITSIGNDAFSFTRISAIDIPNSVTEIGSGAFDATDLAFIEIPSSVTELSNSLFFQCHKLQSVSLPNTLVKIGDNCFMESGIEHIEIPNSVKEIGYGAFYCVNNESKLESIEMPLSLEELKNSTFQNCKRLKNIRFPIGLKRIGQQVFNGCTSITFTNDIPEGVESIGYRAFGDCPLESINLPSTLTQIEWEAFIGCNSLMTIKSKMSIPCEISENTFTANTFFNASLFVPKGTISNYKDANHWKKFVYISDDSQDPATVKCSKPHIKYSNGKLTFTCETEGAVCQSTITDADITSYSDNEVQLGVTYNISVYATKTGCENSDVATATLCWIDVEPKTEGIENNVSQVRANALLIQGSNGTLNVTGAKDGLSIAVYNMSGVMVGSAKASGTPTSIATGIKNGEIAIVKIGEKTVKVVMK